MKQKKSIGVLFGGRSAEHEVSLRSARTVVSALDPKKYNTILIGVDRRGKWWLDTATLQMLQAPAVEPDLDATEVVLIPTDSSAALINSSTGEKVSSIDVLFPVLHGPYGEDGSIQGCAQLANVACVGSGILGSAVGMDKDVMKRLLRDAGIPIVNFITVSKQSISSVLYQSVNKSLGKTVFIKPANMGSSVGVSKVSSAREYQVALDTAFKYDRKVIIEEYIQGREIECAVLGNGELEVSIPGEVISHDSFYSYDAKYATTSESECQIPAVLSADVVALVQQLARQAFDALEARGMARVDFFYSNDGRLLVNEINTIPGFTSISMYPKLWQASGVPLPNLVDRLIELAVADFEDAQQRLTSPATL